MKEYYTIGETASLLGITKQTLRYYDKIGLLSPKYTDTENNYRYYAYQQFHLIDRIKYLQSFGISLNDIKVILNNGDSNDCILSHLKSRKEELKKEEQNIKREIRNLEWYINYHMYMDGLDDSVQLYSRNLPERYIISCPCRYREKLADMEIRLAQVKADPDYENESFLRQYGYILDVDSLFKGEFYPRRYFTFLSSRPASERIHYETLPAGEYMCMRTQMLHEDWATDHLKAYFGKKLPGLAVGLEFEDNLTDWSDAWYELQMLVSK